MPGRAYPFRFYGRRPSDWFEGANAGHLYEIQFEKAPTAEEKAALAEAFEKKLKRGPVEAALQPWLWADRSVQVRLGERRRGGDAFFDAMEALLRALHRVAPIEQAIFWGCREPFGAHAWDRWSLAQRATPDSPFRGPAQAQGDTDLAFEEAREIARDGAEAVAARKAREAKARRSGKLAAVPIARSARPAHRQVDPETMAKLSGLQIMSARRSETGRIIASVVDSEQELRLVHFDDAGALRFSDVSPSRFDPGIHVDGVAAYLPGFGPEGEGVYEVSLPDGKHRLLLPIPIGFETIVVGGLAGGLLAVGQEEELRIYDVAAEPKLLATHALEGEAMELAVVRAGRVAVVTASGMTTVIGIRDRVSAELGKPLLHLVRCYEADGRIIAESSEAQDYELVNVDAAFERAFAKR